MVTHKTTGDLCAKSVSKKKWSSSKSVLGRFEDRPSRCLGEGGRPRFQFLRGRGYVVENSGE